MPEREPTSGAWRGGAQPGDKLKPNDTLRGLHSVRAAGSRSPQHKHLPPVFVSELRAHSGERYLMTQTLTQGSQGKFRICSRNGQFYGVKEYRLVPKDDEHTAPIRPDALLGEWRIAAQHGGMRVYDIIVQSDTKVLVITDLHDSNVGDNLRRVHRRDLQAYARGTLLHLAKHLEAVHAQRIVHRDIKPANIFLGARGVVLGDFGHAEALQDDDDKVRASGGTPAYMSREVVFEQPHGPSADAWSAAMTWCAVHRLPTPFNSMGLEDGYGRAMHLFNTYTAWHASLCDTRGRVDLTRIPAATPTYDFEEWDDWGAKAKLADASMFEHLLNGPAHPNPDMRPTLAHEVVALQAFVGPTEQRKFDRVVHRLRREASYVLRPKSSNESSGSGPLTYPVSVIKEDLHAFASVLRDHEDNDP